MNKRKGNKHMEQNYIFSKQLVSVTAPHFLVYKTIVENDEQFKRFFKMVKDEIEKDRGKNIEERLIPEAHVLRDIENFQDIFAATGKQWAELSLWDRYEDLIGWYASFKIGKVYFDNGCLSYN